MEGHMLCDAIYMKCQEEADPETKSGLVVNRGEKGLGVSAEGNALELVLTDAHAT